MQLINYTSALFMTKHDIPMCFTITLNVHISGLNSKVIMQNAFYNECTLLITNCVVHQLPDTV